MNGQILLIGVALGLLSTVVMDLGGGLSLLLGVACHNPKRMGHELIRRWVGYLFRGQFKYTDILCSPSGGRLSNNGYLGIILVKG